MRVTMRRIEDHLCGIASNAIRTMSGWSGRPSVSSPIRKVGPLVPTDVIPEGCCGIQRQRMKRHRGGLIGRRRAGESSDIRYTHFSPLRSAGS